MDAGLAVRLVGGVALLLTNGFFVTTEFAMTRVRQFQQEAFTGHPGLERAWEMSERLEIYLSGCQVGITVSSVGLGVVAEPAVAAAIDPLLAAVGLGGGGGGHTALSVLLALVTINLAHVVFGEQAPTYLGVERTRWVAKHGSRPLYWWTKLLSPVILASDWAAKATLGLFGVTIDRSWADEEREDAPSRSELREQMGATLARAGLSSERKEEVINALEIGHTPVREEMVPREDIVALSTADTFEENLERLQTAPRVRFPLVGADLETFEGIVYTPALLEHLDDLRGGSVSLAEIAAAPMTVSDDTPVSDVIDAFQAERQELALVESDGEVVGLVTATDAFECITGELEDPLD
jgi:CBS domain containing-hemolysin-like protein